MLVAKATAGSYSTRVGLCVGMCVGMCVDMRVEMCVDHA